MTETSTGAEFISSAHVRHIMRYANACRMLDNSRSVLDAACGTGYGTKLLSKYCQNVLGVDFDEPALIEAWRERVPHNCQFMKADLLTAAFQNIDAIVSIETLEHFTEEDGLQLLKKFHSWITPQGILIVTTPYCAASGPSPITLQHLWEYSLTDFEEVLHQSGFEIEFIKADRHDGKAGRRGYAMAKAIKR